MENHEIKLKAKETAHKIAELLAEKQGFNIVVIDVVDKSHITDYFVVATARSATNAKSLCEYVQEKLEEEGKVVTRIDGEKEGKWIVMDYTTVIVHIFHEELRDFYKFERLWVEPDESNVTHFMGVK